MATFKKLVAGNWKMNGISVDLAEAESVARDLAASPAVSRVAFCTPATLVHRASERLAGSVVLVGGQNLHAQPCGAYTGEVSGAMLADSGAAVVIIGHSERRAYCGETDAQVADKVRAALKTGLEPIICVGETLEQREAGWTVNVVESQLAQSLPDELDGKAFAIGYEPLWAIGTGLTPSIDEIEAVHDAIYAHLSGRFGNADMVPILYGGSVKPSNAEEILNARHVGGALVGGASLKAVDFLPIIRAAG